MTQEGAIAKVVVRLLPDLDEMLRERIRRKGDLVKLLESALNEVDLGAVPVASLSFGEAGVKPTTVNLSAEEHERIKQCATTRGCSVNALINSAVRSYLEGNAPLRKKQPGKAR